jgi:hypothetical protein
MNDPSDRGLPLTVIDVVPFRIAADDGPLTPGVVAMLQLHSWAEQLEY